MDLRKEEVMTFFGSLDMYKAKRTDDRYIYTVYGEDHPIFRTNYFVGLGATYRITKQPYSWLPLIGNRMDGRMENEFEKAGT